MDRDEIRIIREQRLTMTWDGAIQALQIVLEALSETETELERCRELYPSLRNK